MKVDDKWPWLRFLHVSITIKNLNQGTRKASGGKQLAACTVVVVTYNIYIYNIIYCTIFAGMSE